MWNLSPIELSLSGSYRFYFEVGNNWSVKAYMEYPMSTLWPIEPFSNFLKVTKGITNV